MDALPPARPSGDTARPRSLLDRYEAIADISRLMVRAAQEQQWNEVARLEAECVMQVRRLKYMAQLHRLAPDDQAARVRLLRSILADDAEIRSLAEPWLNDLERLLLPAARTQES